MRVKVVLLFVLCVVHPLTAQPLAGGPSKTKEALPADVKAKLDADPVPQSVLNFIENDVPGIVEHTAAPFWERFVEEGDAPVSFLQTEKDESSGPSEAERAKRKEDMDALFNKEESEKSHDQGRTKHEEGEEEEEEEEDVGRGSRMARRIRRRSAEESAEFAEASATYMPPPALKALIDAFLQDVVPPLVEKLAPMLSAGMVDEMVDKLVASVTEAVGPCLTAAITEHLTPSVCKALTPELTSSLTKSLTHSVTASLTNTLTHSLTHTLTHALCYSLTRSLTHCLTQTLTQTVTHSITKSLYQVVANLHNNYNYYLYYQCYYYYNHCEHVNHGVKCYFPKYCHRFYG